MARDEETFEDHADAKRNGPSIFLILLIVVAIVIAIFIAQNREDTNIEFLFFDFGGRVWTVIAIAIGLGVLLDRVILMWWRRARRDRDE